MQKQKGSAPYTALSRAGLCPQRRASRKCKRSIFPKFPGNFKVLVRLRAAHQRRKCFMPGRTVGTLLRQRTGTFTSTYVPIRDGLTPSGATSAAMHSRVPAEKWLKCKIQRSVRTSDCSGWHGWKHSGSCMRKSLHQSRTNLIFHGGSRAHSDGPPQDGHAALCIWTPLPLEPISFGSALAPGDRVRSCAEIL